MGFIGLITSIIMTSTLKDKYHFDFFKLKNGSLWCFFVLWFASSTMFPAVIIGWIILSKLGVFDNMLNKYNQQKYFKNQQMYNPNNMNPYAKNQQGVPNGQYRYNTPVNNEAGSNPYNLPKKTQGREKIIQKFNEKYNINLTSNQISTVAAATYMSKEWASEVYTMQNKYNTVYEWLGQGNIWLRVYLYAFNVQDVNPVFSQQEYIVYNSFDKIFSDILTDENLPTEIAIENINRKYLTNFDEISFLLAVNYMERKGRRYKFGSPILTNVNSEMDDLERKYSRM